MKRVRRINESESIEAEVVGQGALFDYAALGVEDSVIVQQRTSEIKSLAKRVASDIVEIGGKLADVRGRLKNGKFKDWLDAEFPHWGQRSAYNFMKVWEEYGSADFAIDGIAPSALYLLAAPSTPKAARVMAKQLVEAGQEVSHATAQEIVKQAKAQRPKQEELIEDEESEGIEAEEPAPVEVEAAEESRELPPGWKWAAGGCRKPNAYRAEDPARNLRTLSCPTAEEVIWAAHEIEAGYQRGARADVSLPNSLAGGPDPVEPVSKPTTESAQKRTIAETLSAPIERPEGWRDMRIEISITLLPGGEGETRQILHKVRAGDVDVSCGETEQATGEDEILRSLSAPQLRCLKAAVSAWVKVNTDGDEKRERLRERALAIWRGERAPLDDEEDDMRSRPGFPPVFDVKREEKELAQDDDDKSESQVQEVPQADIDMMAEYYAAQEIDKEAPVKICYIDGQPHVITSCGDGDGSHWGSVNAWPILPLAEVGEENARTIKQANDEYYAMLEDDEADYKPLNYKGVKINCGSRKKPAWWVIVGPETVFKVDYSADYPDDEIEAPVDELVINESPRANPQVNEFGVYVEGEQRINVPLPKKAGKTEVVIRLVHDQADGMWRSSYSARAGAAGVSSPVADYDPGYESREIAVRAAGEKARAFLLGQVDRGGLSDSQRRQVEAAIPALDDWMAVNAVDHCAAYPGDEIKTPIDYSDDDWREQAIKKLIERVKERPGTPGYVLMGEGFTKGTLAEAESRGLIENIDGHRWYVWTTSDVTAAISSSGPLTRAELRGLGCQLHVITQAEMEGLIQQSGDKFLLKPKRARKGRAAR